MNAAGIDVSKGKNTVVVMRSSGEVAISSFEVNHIPTSYKARFTN